MVSTTTGLPVSFIENIDDHREAVDRLKLLNRGAGFTVTILRTKTDRGPLKTTRKVFLHCWRSKAYKSRSLGLRKRTSKSTECPWRACMIREESGWRVDVVCAEHNHELEAGSPSASINQRRQKMRAPRLELVQQDDPESGPPALPVQPYAYPYADSRPQPPPGSQAYPSPYVQNPAQPNSGAASDFSMLNQLQHAAGYAQQQPWQVSGRGSMQQTPQQPTQHHPQPPQVQNQGHAGYQGQQGQRPLPHGHPPQIPGYLPAQPQPRPPQAQNQPPQPPPPPAPRQPPPQNHGQASEAPRSRVPELSKHPRKARQFRIQIKRTRVPVEQRAVSSARYQLVTELPAFLIYHASFEDILGDKATLMIAYEEEFPFASAAAVFLPRLDQLFIASMPFVPKGKYEKTVVLSRLMWRPRDSTWYRKESQIIAAMPSGGTNYGDGVLFCAQGDWRDSGGLVKAQADYPYTSKVILNNYHGRRFNSINNVVVHTDGSMWFTDNIYGFERGTRPKPELPSQVYRFEPQTGEVRVMADGFGRPNAICFSADEQTLYVSDTDMSHGDGSIDSTRASIIYAFDIVEKHGSKWIINRRPFAMPDSGIANHLDCDTAGNVYAACGDGLNVWNPAGSLMGKVLVKDGIKGFCFARSGEMFLLSGTTVYILTLERTVQGSMLSRMGVAHDPPVERAEQEESDSDGDHSMESLFEE